MDLANWALQTPPKFTTGLKSVPSRFLTKLEIRKSQSPFIIIIIIIITGIRSFKSSLSLPHDSRPIIPIQSLQSPSFNAYFLRSAWTSSSSSLALRPYKCSLNLRHDSRPIIPIQSHQSPSFNACLFKISLDIVKPS